MTTICNLLVACQVRYLWNPVREHALFRA
jgi:hypothetical protein